VQHTTTPIAAKHLTHVRFLQEAEARRGHERALEQRSAERSAERAAKQRSLLQSMLAR